MNFSIVSHLLQNETLPVAIVDLDAFDENIRKIKEMVSNFSEAKTVRVASKSLRVPELLKRILNSGPPFQGLMCFSAREAEALAEAGFNDLLIAYPTFQSTDLERLCALKRNKIDIILMIDSIEGVELLEKKLPGDIQDFSVCVEIDMALRFFGGTVHLGVKRSPLHSLNDIKPVLEKIKRSKKIKFSGFMGYEAQIAGLPDKNPFKKSLNPLARIVRHLSVSASAKKRLAISNYAKSVFSYPFFFNGGGTGSFNYSLKENSLTEVTAGSAFFCSHLFDYYSNITFKPSLYFALQTVRRPDSKTITCESGGFIASGEPGWDKVPRPIFPDGLKLLNSEGCGEVQTPLMGSTEKIKLTDPVFFRHAKAGELAERFNEYLLVSQDKIVGKAKTYRGLGHSF